MNISPEALLALISDLYSQVARLTAENEKLRAAQTDAPQN